MSRRLLMALLLALPGAALAAGLPLMSSTPGPGGAQSYSLSLQMLLFMTGLSFIPAMVLMLSLIHI